MTTMEPDMKPSQRARDAAADLWCFGYAKPAADEIRAKVNRGELDDHMTMQAFARFERNLSLETDGEAVSSSFINVLIKRARMLADGLGNDERRCLAQCADYLEQLSSTPIAPSTAPADMREADLRKMLGEFEDYIDQPPSYEDQRMVRDYRHELYRKWQPLCRSILSLLASSPDAVREALGPARDWDAKIAELYDWTGSKFLSGEKQSKKQASMDRSQLYSWLCGLGGYLMAARDAASEQSEGSRNA